MRSLNQKSSSRPCEVQVATAAVRLQKELAETRVVLVQLSVADVNKSVKVVKIKFFAKLTSLISRNIRGRIFLELALYLRTLRLCSITSFRSAEESRTVRAVIRAVVCSRSLARQVKCIVQFWRFSGASVDLRIKRFVASCGSPAHHHPHVLRTTVFVPPSCYEDVYPAVHVAGEGSARYSRALGRAVATGPALSRPFPSTRVSRVETYVQKVFSIGFDPTTTSVASTTESTAPPAVTIVGATAVPRREDHRSPWEAPFENGHTSVVE
ncbi:uncharacterized protein LOC134290760 [Aedes albopictus]|uniref:Secreted protein n=1 Tax=Aedes albopictus TaxID=7160 RepID=A0ABM1Z3N3_AEDAL